MNFENIFFSLSDSGMMLYMTLFSPHFRENLLSQAGTYISWSEMNQCDN